MSLANSHLSSRLPQNPPPFRHSRNLTNSTISQNRLKQSASTHRQTSQNRSSQNLQIAKLESRALELQKKLDTQIYQLDVLSSETQYYMKICDEQKEELNRNDMEMLRQEYQEQIDQLVIQKQKITELIYSLTEEYREVQVQCDQRLQTEKNKNQELTTLIEEALNDKELILKEIAETDKIHEQNQEIIFEQEDRIDQLRNIQRKLVIALKELKMLQGKK